MSNDDWKDSPYGREARERSIDEAREQIREAQRQESERRCRCASPARCRVYLGVWLCALCQRLINPNGGGGG